uniref:U3 small nucleolar ribonucleoprotein protein IMP3 n=1 Tax=Prasinoderma coloniale TaxID=156133 RepID=A0A7R9TFH4_9VIRI
MRRLKHHEQKLLKRVNFLQWRGEHGGREVEVMRRYHITERDDYKKYNKLVGLVTKLVSVLRKFPPSDAFRADLTSKLLRKLYENGLTPSQGSLAQAEKLATSALCRRRLAVMLVRLKFCETLREATTFVEQGHVRVGPDTVRDPAFHVTRAFEDFITWNDQSKVRRQVLRYHDKLDDADLL